MSTSHSSPTTLSPRPALKRVWVHLTIVLGFIALLPLRLLAQMPQADGDYFGSGGNYWSGLLGELAGSVCGPIGLLRGVLGITSVVLMIWFAFKGAQGHKNSWRIVIALVLLLAFVLAPYDWFRLLGVESLLGPEFLEHWATCAPGS